MTGIEALEQIKEYIGKKKDEIYNDMGYADKHNFSMERMALQYKSSVLSDINGEILVMLHKLYTDKKASLIPLTEDFLKVNGFKLLSNDGKFLPPYVLRGDNYIVEVYQTENTWVIDVECSYYDNGFVDKVHKCGNYVNELQEALQLCGLSVLANGFKIG